MAGVAQAKALHVLGGLLVARRILMAARGVRMSSVKNAPPRAFRIRVRNVRIRLPVIVGTAWAWRHDRRHIGTVGQSFLRLPMIAASPLLVSERRARR